MGPMALGGETNDPKRRRAIIRYLLSDIVSEAREEALA